MTSISKFGEYLEDANETCRTSLNVTIVELICEEDTSESVNIRLGTYLYDPINTILCALFSSLNYFIYIIVLTKLTCSEDSI